jgi:hypothetical protein
MEKMITFFDGENTITYSEWDLLKEPTMTPTQIKAKEMAVTMRNDLFDLAKERKLILHNDTLIAFAIIDVNNTINAISKMKGMGKISKVRFWKLVKENLENE